MIYMDRDIRVAEPAHAERRSERGADLAGQPELVAAEHDAVERGARRAGDLLLGRAGIDLVIDVREILHEFHAIA